MSTNIEVANSALYDINVDPISSFNDPCKAAQVITTKFQGVLDTVLSSNAWNCNREIKTLNYAAVDDTYGWDYAYTIPNDCLYIRAIVPASNISTITPETLKRFNEFSISQVDSDLYMRTDKYIYANTDELLLIYSKRIKDCSQLPAYITKAVITCLASEIAYPLTQDRQVRSDQLGIYDMALKSARAANAREENVEVPVSSLILSRL